MQAKDINFKTVDVHSKRYLIVDDTKTNRLLLRKMLEKLGCMNIDVAKNGHEAIKLFFHQKYDLIFMDCDMPIMDGCQTTKAIRTLEQKNRLKHTEIIAITGNSETKDITKCQEFKMDHFLSKPFDLEKIKNVLESNNNDFVL